MFAKLFGADDNQILVKLDTSEKGTPEVRVYFEPKGLGVCSIAFEYEDDSKESWKKAEDAFLKITEKVAKEAVAEQCALFGIK